MLTTGLYWFDKSYTKGQNAEHFLLIPGVFGLPSAKPSTKINEKRIIFGKKL